MLGWGSMLLAWNIAKQYIAVLFISQLSKPSLMLN